MTFRLTSYSHRVYARRTSLVLLGVFQIIRTKCHAKRIIPYPNVSYKQQIFFLALATILSAVMTMLTFALDWTPSFPKKVAKFNLFCLSIKPQDRREKSVKRSVWANFQTNATENTWDLLMKRNCGNIATRLKTIVK